MVLGRACVERAFLPALLAASKPGSKSARSTREPLPVRRRSIAEEVHRLHGVGTTPAESICSPERYTLHGIHRRGIAMPNEHGLVQVPSRYSVEETVQRLQSTFAAKGLQVFALIDHSGEAAKVGLEMRPTKVLIFGSPKGGTPLMIAAPSLAIDLPMKALVAEDENGKVWLTYNSPDYFQQRHGVPEELIKNLAGTGPLMEKAVE